MNLVLLSTQIQKDPGVIVGPITSVLGYILNFIFDFVYAITVESSLAFAIILLTIAVRTLMLPLGIKQQKSMQKMQELAPEIEAIKNKYGKTKDPETNQKMNKEIQELYQKNNVNPFAGCLPIFIQMPIFISLHYLMNQPYVFINKLGVMYTEMSKIIMNIPNYYMNESPFFQLAIEKVPKSIKHFDIKILENVEKVVNKITDVEWNGLLVNASSEVNAQMTELLADKNAIEYFMGINLTDSAGFTFPGIIIPILAGITTFLTSYLMMKRTTTSSSEQAQTQQKVMLYGMPIMMGFMTASLTAGVGVYWITSNIYQIVQQLFLNKSRDKEKIEEKVK